MSIFKLIDKLDKSVNGGWQKDKGYKFHTQWEKFPDNSGKFLKIAVTHDSKGHHDPWNNHDEGGSAIANASFYPPDKADAGESRWVGMPWVDELHTRKGIASSMYQLAEKTAEMKLKPDNSQTSFAKKLWNNPNRSFGKSEPVKEFEKTTSGRHSEAPGEAQSTMTKPVPEREHIRADTQTHQNFKYELGKSTTWHVKVKGNRGYHAVKDIEDHGDKGNIYCLNDGRKIPHTDIEDLDTSGNPDTYKLRKISKSMIRLKGLLEKVHNPEMEELEKAAPAYEGEEDHQKKNIAVKHPLNSRELVWQHHPEKAKSFQNTIDQNIDKFTSQFGEHGPVLKNQLLRVLANKKHADLVPTSLKRDNIQAPRRRHVAFLLGGNGASKLKHMGNGEFLWHQDRHATGGYDPETWWKVNHQGIQDVTKEYAGKAKEIFGKSDNLLEGGDNYEYQKSRRRSENVPGRALKGNGVNERKISKSDDLTAINSDNGNVRLTGHSRYPSGTGRDSDAIMHGRSNSKSPLKFINDLQKGRKPMALGTITERGGKKFKKESSGWVPVKEISSQSETTQVSAPKETKSLFNIEPKLTLENGTWTGSINDTVIFTSHGSKEDAERIMNREVKKAEVEVNAHNMTLKEYLDAAINAGNYANSKKTKDILSRRYIKHINAAQSLGLSISENAKTSHPELAGIPEILDDKNQQKTKLFKSVNLEKVPKKRQPEVFQMLKGANVIVSDIGVVFKQSLHFRADSSLRGGDNKSTRATYEGGGGGHRSIALKDITQAETSLMHEIGHAIDYALSASSSSSVTRSDEMSKDESELGNKYRELSNLVKNSGKYKNTDPGKYRLYLNNNTEVFARAFEVYSLSKARRLISEGKLDKTFIDRYMPDIFFDPKNPVRIQILEEMKKLDSEVLDGRSKINERYRTLREQAEKESPGNAAFRVVDLTNEDSKYKELVETNISLLKQKAILYDKYKASKNLLIPEDQQEEYIHKVTELMDYILKNDPLKKSHGPIEILRKPFKSEAQRRFFHWAANHHKKGISEKTVNHWESVTGDKKLPEKLDKGATSRLHPYNPRKDSPEGGKEHDAVRSWVVGNHSEARDSIPRMTGNQRIHAIHKISGRTESRKNPETGELEFKMHRGMSPEEHDNHLKGNIKERTSWTLDPNIAHGFASRYKGKVSSAWIPESKIHHMPNMLSHDQWIKGLNREQEIIVDPHKTNIDNSSEKKKVPRWDPNSELKDVKKYGSLEEAKNFIKNRLNIHKSLIAPPIKLSKSEKPQIATIAVMDGNKLLMAKRNDNGRFTTPGGHLESEENPLEGAKRELFEESGIDVPAKSIKYLGSENATTHTGKNIIVHCFILLGKFKTNVKNDPDKEVNKWEYIDVSKGLPKEVANNLHSPKNCLLRKLGLQKN